MCNIIGPDFIALQVRDITAAKRFYTEVLGFTETAEGPPHAVVFATSPIPFAIREPVVDLDEVSQLGWGVALWFNCERADTLHDKLKALGQPIVQAPVDGPFGRTFSFIDPDGYQITLHGTPG